MGWCQVQGLPSTPALRLQLKQEMGGIVSQLIQNYQDGQEDSLQEAWDYVQAQVGGRGRVSGFVCECVMGGSRVAPSPRPSRHHSPCAVARQVPPWPEGEVQLLASLLGTQGGPRWGSRTWVPGLVS